VATARVGTHRHATNCGHFRIEDGKHRLAHETRSSSIEGRLSSVDVPVADGAAAQGVRTVDAQRIGSQVFDESLTGHINIVLVRGAESATRWSV
jgi:hypothetical protein